jgi:hypothetical protein
MSPIEHFNAFCVLFAQLKSICESGSQRRESQEAKDVCKKMYGHYPFFEDKMVKYMDKFTSSLVSMGFSFEEMVKFNKVDKPNKVDVGELDRSEEVKVTGKFSCAKLVDSNERGKIYNYNEHTVPLEKLSLEDFQLLRQRTLDNIKREQHMLATGQRPKSRQPKTWSLPDAARDW